VARRYSRQTRTPRPAGTLDPWPLDPPRPDPAPDPAPVTDERAAPSRRDTAPTRAANDHFCRRCRSTGTGPIPPAGWLRLQRRSDQERAAYRWSTSGIYCSLDCLVADFTPE
jgi:hypothetical protein